MYFIKSTATTLLLLLFCFPAFTQDFRKTPGYRFSREDISDFLLYQGKKEKTRGIIALVAGSVLTSVGFYLSGNSSDATAISMGRVTYPSAVGKAIGTTGLVTGLLSIPFFLSAKKAKREARLVLASRSAGIWKNKIVMPGIGVRFDL